MDNNNISAFLKKHQKNPAALQSIAPYAAAKDV
jgi:hypothetical protein